MIIPGPENTGKAIVDVAVPSNKTITATEALSALFSGLPIQTLLIIGLVVFVAWDRYNTNNNNVPVTPVPSPAPYNPSQKTLKDLVSPEAAQELASFYHGMATVLYEDKGRVEVEGEGPVVKTIGDFYTMSKLATQSFQTANQITGIAAVGDPIGVKLKVATGSLDPSKSLDDPATKVRDSLVAACKQISVEFDERYSSIPVGRIK
jgi:hypothetical protein